MSFIWFLIKNTPNSPSIESVVITKQLDHKLAKLWIIMWSMCIKRQTFLSYRTKMSLIIAIFIKKYVSRETYKLVS